MNSVSENISKRFLAYEYPNPYFVDICTQTKYN